MRRPLSYLQFLPWLLTATLLACGPGEPNAQSDTQRAPEMASRSFAEEIPADVQTKNCPTATASIIYNKELFISDSATLDDPCRTKGEMCSDMKNAFKWNFMRLMREMAGGETVSDAQVSAFTLNWLYKFVDSLTVNGQKLENRTKLLSLVINPWRVNSGCSIDRKDSCLLKARWAPFRLLAVVNRMDVRGGKGGSYGSGTAGEGRLIFGFLKIDPTGAETPLAGTVILEYELPASSSIDMIDWGDRWHALGGLALGTENYRKKLQSITDQFAMSGVKSKANFNNGSAILRVRTGEHSFEDPAAPVAYHEFREFQLQCPAGDTMCPLTRTGAQLLPVPTGQTPDSRYQTDMMWAPKLVTVLNTQASAVLNERHEVPADFLSGAAQIEIKGNAFRWTPMTTDPTVRRLFAFSTCTGCHFRETQSGKDDTLTGFFVDPDTRTLNDFMTKLIKVTDVTGKDFYYNEKLRRQCEFEYLLISSSRTPLTAPSGRAH